MYSNFSILCPSTQEKVNVLMSNPYYAEYKQFNKELVTCGSEQLKNEKSQKFSNWSPIVKESNRNCVELQKYFHPAIVKDQRLFKINDAGINIFNSSFLWDPELKEELVLPGLVDRFITFHTCGYHLYFKPSIHEVLTQLPEKVIESKSDFYFTTETIDDDPNNCVLASNMKYHIAVTSIYRV